MTIAHKTLIVIATLLLMAGCSYLGYRAYSTLNNTKTIPPRASTSTQTTTTKPTASATSSTPANTISTPQIDSSWRTFRSKENTFEFMWPTQGSYMPQWEQKMIRKGDKNLSNAGCYLPDTGWNINTFTVNNLNFCQTSKSLITNGKTFLTDHFSVTKDHTEYVILTFTKSFITTSTTFKIKEYDQTLKQIAYTFHFVRPATTATTWKNDQSTELGLSFKTPTTEKCILPKSVNENGTCYSVDQNGQPLGYTPDVGISLMSATIADALKEFDPIESSLSFTTEGGFPGTKITSAYGKGLCTEYLVELSPNQLLRFTPWQCENDWEPLETLTKSLKKDRKNTPL